jgi:hypothetical protein
LTSGQANLCGLRAWNLRHYNNPSRLDVVPSVIATADRSRVLWRSHRSR